MNFKIVLFDKIMNLDKIFKKIMFRGFIFSFILCIVATTILFTYESFYNNPILFYAGISLMHNALMYGVTFIICGIGFDTIKKQIAK